MNSYEKATKQHVSMNNNINGGDPKIVSSRDQHIVGNSAYVHPQSSMMGSVDTQPPPGPPLMMKNGQSTN